MGKGDEITSRLAFKIFSTLLPNPKYYDRFFGDLPDPESLCLVLMVLFYTILFLHKIQENYMKSKLLHITKEVGYPLENP